MSTKEPQHDPADLLDELDSILREQELLRQRTLALAARYRSLEAHASRFDKPGKYERLPAEYGHINVEYAAIRLVDSTRDMSGAVTYHLLPARELAEKVREYPRPERESAEPPRVDRGRSR